MNLEIYENPITTKWDEQLGGCHFANPLQASAYADYLRAQGSQVHAFTFVQAGQAIGHCLVSVSRNKTATWSFGPVLREPDSQTLNQMLVLLIPYLRKHLRIRAVETARLPAFYTGQEYPPPTHYDSLGQTPYIDLQQDLETLNRSYDRSVRKNVRKCQDAGVEITITNDPAALEPYLAMLTDFRSQRGLRLPPFYPNAQTLQYFNRPHTGMYLALAHQGGEYLAGMGLVTYHQLMTEIAVAEAPLFHERKLPVNDLIKVRAIEHFREQGIRYYDLAGVSRQPADAKQENIRRFKLKFTQNLADYGIIGRRVFSPLWYFYRAIHR